MTTKTTTTPKLNACLSLPCKNGATCRTNGNGYSCTCRTFYSGVNCQTCKQI